MSRYKAKYAVKCYNAIKNDGACLLVITRSGRDITRLIKSLKLSGHMASWILVNIGSGNGLVPDSIKPLPEPMLTYFQIEPWVHISVSC